MLGPPPNVRNLSQIESFDDDYWKDWYNRQSAEYDDHTRYITDDTPAWRRNWYQNSGQRFRQHFPNWQSLRDRNVGAARRYAGTGSTFAGGEGGGNARRANRFGGGGSSRRASVRAPRNLMSSLSRRASVRAPRNLMSSSSTFRRLY